MTAKEVANKPKTNKAMATMLDEHNAIRQFLSNTDFSELKKQKKTLIKVISNLVKSDEQEGEDAEQLEGLLNLIESFQDMVVDKFNFNNR